ncbi:carboxymuconolactone decarboxylase family protein [Motiliproteus coralliicola]|uniref:Carboxymuconolactone decarboxylase family protein n=1 Tax=Motiliproteus coralliicola TaxID=2283196 RepID=A0A369WBN9_9GAMM|nr:carboxymuconolactone decarboxylase family protein [Motiliproteus coralliicola]RDE19428.1 carboxymuconolactone decarboxylase family protein [Motiliproteus coralliicola]
MTSRADYFNLAPQAMQILLQQEDYLRAQFNSSEILNIKLWELVKLRVSQINQCAFCIDMHSKDALNLGETNERILGLNAWRDMPHYSDLERTALDWAEHLTRGQPVNDQRYQDLVRVLGEKGVVDLTLAINAINSWNRVAKTFKPEVGSYKPN